MCDVIHSEFWVVRGVSRETGTQHQKCLMFQHCKLPLVIRWRWIHAFTVLSYQRSLYTVVQVDGYSHISQKCSFFLSGGYDKARLMGVALRSPSIFFSRWYMCITLTPHHPPADDLSVTFFHEAPQKISPLPRRSECHDEGISHHLEVEQGCAQGFGGFFQGKISGA